MAEKIVKDSQGLAKDLVNDCISRQAAIDAINGVLVEDDACKVWFRLALQNLPSAQPDTGYSDGFADGYKQGRIDAQPEQQWIPCSERLPSKADHTDDMVLVCYRNGSVRFNTYMNGWVQGNPVAWMPLPKGYKGE